MAPRIHFSNLPHEVEREASNEKPVMKRQVQRQHRLIAFAVAFAAAREARHSVSQFSSLL